MYRRVYRTGLGNASMIKLGRGRQRHVVYYLLGTGKKLINEMSMEIVCHVDAEAERSDNRVLR